MQTGIASASTLPKGRIWKRLKRLHAFKFLIWVSVTGICPTGIYRKGGSCHLFRHTVASLMLDNGADIRFIQQMLGHVSIGTTEIYTHVLIVKLKQIHEMTHPTLRQKPRDSAELEANEEELLSTLNEEKMEDEGV